MHPPLNITPATHTLSLGDVYYAVFRHKWRILTCTALGLLAALAIAKFYAAPYQSEAKLFIRYVVTEGKSIGPAGDGAVSKSPDQRGETIMDSELEILSSLDLARQVAETVGPEKILAKMGGGKDLDHAALVIQKGLTADVPPMSSVIRIVFKHPDPDVVQPVLRAVVDHYLEMHVAIHRAVGIVGDFLTQETDQLHSRLDQTEDELRKANNKAGVVSVIDAKKAYSEQETRLRDAIFTVQADLAEETAIYQAMTKGAPTQDKSGADISPAQVKQYRDTSVRVAQLQARETDLLTQFTPENIRVKELRAQLASASELKAKMEKEHPALSAWAPSQADITGKQPAGMDPAAEQIRINALQAKVKVLKAELDQVHADSANVDQMEGTIVDLSRRKELEEANYRYYAASLEQARINEALGTGRVSNISQIQTPSPPVLDRVRTVKILAAVGVSGLVLGLVWAFLIEFYLDRSVRRPGDVEKLTRLPLLLSIPSFRRKKLFLTGGGKGEAEQKLLQEAGDESHAFHETLRDRLVGYFESINLTHKPKLVAVTGLGKGSGVTTIASGLARCLSETGEGNVLVVDMTPGQGAAQQFYKGKSVCGLEEILLLRETAQINDKLFVVGEGMNGERLSRILPQRFNKLVPLLKASDFDYIIFDMPPVSQISITPRLAAFMDMVLLVIESEKTDRNVLARASALLAESKAHVAAVLNKTRSYVPLAIYQDSLANV